MGLKNLKSYLDCKSEEFLRGEILALYKKFAVVKEYYELRFDPYSSSDRAQKYKAILEKQFCPSKGLPELKYAIAKKAISDFKKVCRDSWAIIDLQVTYIEYGIKCTDQYGDMDERFYNSMESMFRASLSDMKKSGLLEDFKVRCGTIWEKTQDMGYGIGYTTTDLYEEFFGNTRDI